MPKFIIKFHRTTRTISRTRIVPKDLAKFQSTLQNSIESKATGEPERTWIDTNQWILNAIYSTHAKQRPLIKHWMSHEVMELVEKRRYLRKITFKLTEGNEIITEINTQIKNLSRRDRNRHINFIFVEIRSDHQEPREIFHKMKYLTRKFQAQTHLMCRSMEDLL